MIFVILTALCVVIIVKDVLHYKERKELCDRIMCSDLKDYNIQKQKGKEVQKGRVRKTRHEKALEKWRGF